MNISIEGVTVPDFWYERFFLKDYKASKKLDLPINVDRYKGTAQFDPSLMPVNHLVELSKTLPPWPGPPDTAVTRRILREMKQYPDLFCTKPFVAFNIEKLFGLLQHHPNTEWVKSLHRMLTEGCWPKYDVLYENDNLDIKEYVYENASHSSIDPNIIKKVEEEQLKGWISDATDVVLPGTRFMNLFSKVETDKVRVISDHSYPAHDNTNSFVPNEPAFLDHLSMMSPFTNCYQQGIDANDLSNKLKIVFRKADIGSAYRQVPLHPLAFIKSAIRISPTLVVYDKQVQFGMKNANTIWGYVGVSVAWIMVELFKFPCVLLYVDDFFGPEIVPYNWPDEKPSPGTVCTRQFFEWLKMPFKLSKLLSGSILPILGIVCNAHTKSYSLSDQQILDLLASIDKWLHIATTRKRFKAGSLQPFIGNVMWASNVCPLIRPFVSSLYQIMYTDKASRNGITFPAFAKQDLRCIKQFLSDIPPRHMFAHDCWYSPDVEVWCDASKSHETGEAGIGFWIVNSHSRYFLRGSSLFGNNPLELWCIMVAVTVVVQSSLFFKDMRIRVYCDNQAAVYAVSKRMGTHNDSLRYLSHLQRKSAFSLQVIWVSRDNNYIADKLAKGDVLQNDQSLVLAQHLLDLVQFIPSNLVE